MNMNDLRVWGWNFPPKFQSELALKEILNMQWITPFSTHPKRHSMQSSKLWNNGPVFPSLNPTQYLNSICIVSLSWLLMQKESNTHCKGHHKGIEIKSLTTPKYIILP